MTGRTGFFLFLAAFGFYLQGVSPALDGGDSGEFIASSTVLGVPHAPGYPLFQLLGKAAQVAIPFSTMSYRAHVFSALLGAFFLVLLFRFLLVLFEPDKPWGALAAVIFLGTRPLMIEQARVFEVFVLNAVFLVGVLYAFVRSLDNESAWVALAAFLFGLGLGNHHTLMVLAPLFLIPSFPHVVSGNLYQESPWCENSRGSRLRHSGATMLFFLLGLSIYAYLPLRASAASPVNFGNPDTFERFWAVITRKEFGSASLHPAAIAFRSWGVALEQVAQFFKRLMDQIGWGGGALAVMCLALAWRDLPRRWVATSTLVLFLLLGPVFDAYSNLSPFSDIGQWRLERFMLIPLTAISVLMAMGFNTIGPLIKPGLKTATVGLVIICLSESVRGAAFAPDYRWNLAFRDFAESALRSAPMNARVVIDRVLFDEPTSSLLVATVTENKRSDIQFLYRPGTLFGATYGEDVLQLDWDGRLARQKETEARLLSDASRPVRALAFEKGNTPFKDPRLSGVLYVDGAASDIAPLLINRPFLGDYPSRLISVHIPYFLGKAALERGDMAGAKRWFDRAERQSHGMAWLMSNLGGIYSQQNAMVEATRAFERAVELDPYFPPAQYGLGFVRYKAGDMTSARRAWEKYLALEPRGKMADGIRQALKEI